MKWKIVGLVCWITCISCAQTHEAQIAKFSAKVNQFLNKDGAVWNHLAIDEQGISFYLDSLNKITDTPLKSFTWEQVEALQKATNYKRPTSLNGLRIAIDPGHSATSFNEGHSEGKSIDFSAASNPNTSYLIRFYEAKLTLKTGLALRDKLEAAGAEVFMTRDENKPSAFGKAFTTWMTDDFKQTLEQDLASGAIDASLYNYWAEVADSGQILRHYYGNHERKARADSLNAFAPDLTVIIHFNVDEQNKPWASPTQKNFSMAFIPGSIMRGEIETQEDLEILERMVISKDLDESLRLARSCTEAFEAGLKVPLATIDDASYLKQFSMFSPAPGVFHRNLLLTKLVNGPLIYGETLYQDNATEAAALAHPNGLRLEQVAEAYYQGILGYLRQNR